MFTREALTIDVDQCIKGDQVVEAMTRFASSRECPGRSGWTMPGILLQGVRPLG
jgi:hypothetical protein